MALGEVRLTVGPLRLRPWTPADAPAVLAAFAEPSIAAWNPRLPLAGLDEAAQWVEGRLAGWRDATMASFAVTGTASAALLGSVTLRDLDKPAAEISYWVLPPARGAGVASAAVGVLTSWGFTARELHRIELRHSVRNEASCAVARRCAYGLERVLRDAGLYPDGRHDEHLHARLRTDAEPG
jgi:RimJ/RimL family protein N-acetyltransferase